jgi:hypothetical protein
MPTQTPQAPAAQPQAPTYKASDGTQLDQSVVNLAKAIRTRESGNDYTKMGDADTSAGAYQYNNGGTALKPGQVPANFQAWAKQYGLNPDDFSPVNQDKVAYARISDLKSQGLSPEQVAAVWNGGMGVKDNWQTHKGSTVINGKTIQYDTPAYVKGVIGEFQKLKGPTSTVNAPDTSASAGVDTSPSPDQGGGALKTLGNIYNAIAKPFIGLASIPDQLLFKGINAATGANVPDPFTTQGIPSLGGTTLKGSDLGLEQKLGDAAQVGSYFLPGEGVLGAVGAGALQGGGSAMSEGKGIGDVALNTAEGAALGGAAGGGAKLAGAGLGKLGSLAAGDTAEAAQTGIKQAYSDALNLRAGELSYENRSGKDLAQVLTNHNVPLGRYEDGTLNASEAIPKLQAALRPLNKQADAVLSKTEGVVPEIDLKDTLSLAKRAIGKLNVSPLEKEQLASAAQKNIESAAKRYGMSLDLKTADKLKSGLWATTFRKNRELDSYAPYLVGQQLKTQLEKAVAKTESSTDFKALNQQRGDLIDAIRRLQKLDGVRKVPGGRLGHMFGGLTGTIIGSHFGPLGGLAGDYFGTRASQFMNNPATRIGIAKSKFNATNAVPSLLDFRAKPVGQALKTTGKTLKKSARPAALGANILANSGQQ